ncbi:MAG: HAMP domain-containing protein [Actinobacteria bacterium]|nr:HAMP domain-containing protein [Actinomycetota bacterium]
MSTAATQLLFSAELGLFVVAVAGAVLAARPAILGADRAARTLLATGFVALAACAALRGALVVDRTGDRAGLLALRLSGVALVALGSLRWAGDRQGRWLLLAGLAVVAGAEVSGGVGGVRGAAPDLALAAGAALLAVSLVASGRGSLPARVGASAALLLLVAVLGVSIAVSVVLARNVEDEALRRYAARASTEASVAAGAGRDSLTQARVVAATLRGRVAELTVLADSRSAPAQRAQARTNVEAQLGDLGGDRALALPGPVVVLTPAGAPEAAAPATLARSTRLALAGSSVATEARDQQSPRQAVTVAGDTAYAVGVAPVVVTVSGSARFAGVVVVARPLDATYLRVRAGSAEPVGLALATARAVVAGAGELPRPDLITATADPVLAADARPAGTRAGWFLVGRPVVGGGGLPDLALVTAVPTETVQATRTALLRALFLVALGVALLGTVLATAAAERLVGGLRRLAGAAEAIRAGDLDARAAVDRPDELGRLGATFDAMAGSLRSMTDDLRRAAADEARLRGRLEAVVSGMAEALVATDAAGRVTDVNRAAEALLGMPASELAGRTLAEAVPFSQTSTSPGVAATPAVPLLPVPGGIEVRQGSVSRRSGGDVPVVVTAAALVGPSGEPAGAVLLLRDVRRELEVERMKTEFLANLGHELRTPLTPIKGFASVLRRRDVPRAQQERIAAEITGAVDQLERVVDQLLAFATVVAGRLDLQREPVEAAVVVESAVARWRERAEPAHPVERAVDPAAGVVSADRAQLDRALDELIDNAVKYSPEGGRVVIGAAPDGTGAVRLSVDDEGEGVDPEQLERLLEAFSQADGSATRRFGGLGLGLALADRIARAHGGRVTGESVPGRGSCFSIVVPAVDGSTGAEVTAPGSDPVDVTPS